jgi:hypothetical protein
MTERRAGEGAEGAAAVTTAEALSAGEAAPALDAGAPAVGTLASIAKPAAMIDAEREAEIGDGSVEWALCRHDGKEFDVREGGRIAGCAVNNSRRQSPRGRAWALDSRSMPERP